MRFQFLALLALAASAVVAVPPCSRAQNADVRFRLAQSYERSGDFENAAKLYEEVYAKDSLNMVVFDALRRSYLQLKRYDDGIALMNRVLSRNPSDIGLLAQLGSLYVLKSDEPKASAAWERAIAAAPKQESTYRIVAGAMVQSRLFDKAIAMYQRGRTATGDPSLFAFDIAYLDAIMLNYAEATREYLRMLAQTPGQLAYVQSRIASYTGRAEGLAAATQVADEAVKSDPGNLTLRQLTAWLYMEGKQFDRAFDVYTVIDEKANAQGHELFNFAERALHERACTTAVRAFARIIAAYPKFDLAPQVKFGYAQALEGEGNAGDTLNLFRGANPFARRTEAGAGEARSAVLAAYESVTKEFPGDEVAALSFLRIANIMEENLGDLENARIALEMVVKKFSQFPGPANEATLRLGDVLIALGRLDDAAAAFRRIAGTGPALTPAQERADFRLAELDYFEGKFQDALAKLKVLTANPSSDAANDALGLQIFIQENLQGPPDALKGYARAELLVRQQKLSEALDRFKELLASFGKSDLADETLISIGDLYTRMGRYADADSAYTRLIDGYPESIALDRTTMKLAEVYEFGTNDIQRAIAEYQRLLEKYPASIYASEARKRIRALRGDNI